MFDWLAEQYITLIANYKILLDNPVACNAVDVLKLFTATLFVVFLGRFACQLIISSRLKNKYQQYTDHSNPELMEVYRRAAKDVGLQHLPRLYRFSDEKPVLFTLGAFRPSIFLSHIAVNRMSPDELTAALTHELIHVKRYDGLLLWWLEILMVSVPILIVQLFALSFVFSFEKSAIAIAAALLVTVLYRSFACKKIRFLRELSCDDVTVRFVDPLVLASALINVWRIGANLPRHSWAGELAFAQALLPIDSDPLYRIRRLIDYKAPRVKFLLGRTMRIIVLILAVLLTAFVVNFHQAHGSADTSLGKVSPAEVGTWLQKVIDKNCR